ncbi:MAG: hypothetical protein IPF66_05325 [Holophagales bacterium]|nr:hypothetical protein [Holophagales bacterium]
MIRTRLLAAAAALLVLAACGKKEPEPKVDRAARKALSAQAKSTLGVLPETMPGSEADTPAARRSRQRALLREASLGDRHPVV